MPEIWTYNGRFVTADGERPLMNPDTPPAERERIARLTSAAPDLLAACQKQHQAIDWLMARLVMLDREFLPSLSPAWPAVEEGHAAIAKATGAKP